MNNVKSILKKAALVLVAALVAAQTGCQPAKPVISQKPAPNSTLAALANGGAYTDGDFQSGIVYEDLPDLNAEHSYIVSGRYRQTIAGGIKIGTEKEKLKTLLGKPVAAEGDLALYAFGDIDVGFYGKNKIELAVVRKVTPARLQKSRLKSIVQALSGGKDLKTVAAKNPGVFDYLDSRPYLRGTLAHSNGGVEIYALLQTGTTQVNVYSNYKGDRTLKSGSQDVTVSFIKSNNLAEDMLAKISMYRQIESDFKKSGRLSPDRSKTILNCFRDGVCYYLLLRRNDGKKPDRVLNNIYSMGLHWVDSRFLVNLDVDFTIQILDTETGKIAAEKQGTDVQDIKRVTGSAIYFDGTKGAFALGYKIKNGKFSFTDPAAPEAARR
jgi:hypothetical protein